MTTLSPRLQHLLIHEERGLMLPPPVLMSPRDGSPPSPFSSSDFLNTPLSAKPLPQMTPTPIDTRRPSHISALLNSMTVRSPTSSSGSISPTVPMPHLPTVPLSAPIGPHDNTPFFSQRPSVDIHPSHQPPLHRPDMFRRHSAQPYEINPATNRIIYREFDFSPVGSRTPISRTTKACNACRSRKVRCDAGVGNIGANGETGVCSRCREAGVECVYSGVQKKRGPCPGSARPSISRRVSQKLDSPPSNSTHFESLSPIFASSGWTSTQPRPLPSTSASASTTTSAASTPAMPPTMASRPSTASTTLQRKPSIVSWHPSDIPEERSHRFEQDYSMHVPPPPRSAHPQPHHGPSPPYQYRPVAPLAPLPMLERHQHQPYHHHHHHHDQRQHERHQPTLPMRSSRSVDELPPLRPLTAPDKAPQLPSSGGAFGGDGRSLPPLRVAIQRKASYYSPRE